MKSYHRHDGLRHRAAHWCGDNPDAEHPSENLRRRPQSAEDVEPTHSPRRRDIHFAAPEVVSSTYFDLLAERFDDDQFVTITARGISSAIVRPGFWFALPSSIPSGRTRMPS